VLSVEGTGSRSLDRGPAQDCSSKLGGTIVRLIRQQQQNYDYYNSVDYVIMKMKIESVWRLIELRFNIPFDT